MRSVVLITPPVAEPVILQDMKKFLRVDFPDDDALIGALITAARSACEDYCGIVFVQQQWQQLMDTFPYNPMFPNPTQLDSCAIDPTIYFMRGPVLSVDQLQYMDTTQVLTELDSSWYVEDLNSLPPRIYPQYGRYWPPTLPIPNAVSVKFTAGFVPATGPAPDPSSSPDQLTAYWAANVPMNIKLAIMQTVNFWYERPETSMPTQDALPLVAKALLSQNKVYA